MNPAGKEKIISIDGSFMEGGGQVLRTATALSILTKKPVRIYNIRSNRPQPGLRTQHLRGLEAVAELCNGRLERAKIGSKEVFFYPSEIGKKEINITLDTAASVGLVLQSLLIASVKIGEKLVLNINGGATFGKFAPPLQYIQFVLLPVLRRMGYHAEINILRHGFFPAGGARVKVMISPCSGLKPIDLSERGEIETVNCVSVASASLKKPKVAERQVRVVEKAMRDKGYACDIKSNYVDSSCTGSGVVLVARTDKGCVLGSDGLGEMGKPAEIVAEEALNGIFKAIASGAAVDEHMGDQILPYMALCGQKSCITAPELTMHAKTNMWVIKQFLPVEFETECRGTNAKIECIPLSI
jgi:RNA 3'-terminal phosphate cyclase (ATP)/RNA 3'-terminal phosphate cyclase (GTP)